MKKIDFKNKKGFTLIEMLIAVFIFTASLAALMSISSRAIFAAKEAERHVVGNYLAVEALESVRHIRDSAFLNGIQGDSFSDMFYDHDVFPGCEMDGAFCHMYYSDYPILELCSTCQVWKTNDEKYVQLAGEAAPGPSLTDSGYFRRISFDQLTTEEVLVTVQVGWDGGLVEAHESLLLWF